MDEINVLQGLLVMQKRSSSTERRDPVSQDTQDATDTFVSNPNPFARTPRNQVNRLIILAVREGSILAVRALGDVRGRESDDARRALINLLNNNNTQIRSEAARALGRLEDSPEIVTALTSRLRIERENGVKTFIADALGRMGAGSSLAVIETLTPLLRDENPSVQASAASALGTLGEDLDLTTRTQIIRLLLPLTDDREYIVSRNAIRALGRVGHDSSDAIDTLMALFRNEPSSGIRHYAAIALRRVTNNSEELSQDKINQISNTFLTLLRDDDAGVKMEAAGALTNLSFTLSPPIKQQCITALMPLLRDDDAGVKIEAARALVNVAVDMPQNVQDRVTLALIPLLRDSNSDVMHAIGRNLRVLGTGPEEAVDALIAILQDGTMSYPARVEAMTTLGVVGRGSQEAVDALISFTRDGNNPILISSAATVLYSVGRNAQPEIKNQIVQALLPLLRHENDTIVSNARASLRSVGRGSPEAVLALIRLLDARGENDAIFTLSVLSDVVRDDLPAHVQDQVIRAVTPYLDSNNLNRDTTAVLLSYLGDRLPQQTKNNVIGILISSRPAINDFFLINIEALGRIGQGSQEAITFLTDLMRSNRLALRISAATELGNIGQGSQEAAQVLVDALDSPNAFLRAEATDSLVRIGSVAVPLLIERFEEGSVTALSRIILGIGEGALNDLTEALNHENHKIRAHSAMVLGQILSQDEIRNRADNDQLTTITTRLIALATNGEGRNVSETTDIRVAAVQALGFMRAQSARPFLNRLANDPQANQSMRDAASFALDLIDQS